ncbi:hypothetical protein KSP40_PGU017787 [Platanthera guangdongensis]|uniref:Uncharacterized protein n=1 Tax=Platanthera guangdongensis TaxID=2320717 RepID=A0ABR2MQ04_9ASPA
MISSREESPQRTVRSSPRRTDIEPGRVDREREESLVWTGVEAHKRTELEQQGEVAGPHGTERGGYKSLEPEEARGSHEDEEEADRSRRIPCSLYTPRVSPEESEWLRISLHKWLDEEYCPEPTNFEISRLAAQSYYESLASKETDLGEILLKMARRLETISFQESFHGPYSSANAAVHLITQRIDSTTER